MAKKVALVTGSARGIGQGIARELAGEYQLIISATRDEVEIPEDLKDNAVYIRCNIAESAERERIFKEIDARFGRLDLLVNNAGVAPLVREDILQATEESFDRVLGINLKGTYFMCQHGANYMLQCKEKGLEDYNPRIVNISSMSSFTSSTARGEYCISKAGISMVTKLFADRLAEYDIPVFEVQPGIIDTDITAGVMDKYQKLIDGGLTPTKRFGYPADIGRAVAALASGAFDFCTGQVIHADGGFHLRRL
ncbi:MAG: 3-ketoacyl-ACP reductase [Firmicutes bacterium]|nr:3-ketoacyl-ACP reductase [Bacillota bacterium]